MPFLDGKPVIITKRNTDRFGNPISVKQIETKQVADIHNIIPLNYSIDRNHPILINGLHQIYNENEVSKNTFFADYDQGLLFFHPSRVGQSLTVTYMGTGYILISSARIYRYNKINGSSASESIEASFEKLENLLNTVVKGNATIPGTTAEVITARTDKEGTTYPSLGSRLDAITEKVNNLTTVLRYKNTVNLTSPTRVIDIGIKEYVPSSDVLFVYLSGVRMIEGVDYSLNKANKTITCLKGQWLDGDQLYFEILQKSADTTMGGGGGGGTGGTSSNASNVILTIPIYGQNNVQNALIEIQTKLDSKADKTELNNYLPLAGGTVTGNLLVRGHAIVQTMPTTDATTHAASTAFVRNNVGVLSGLTTNNKNDLVSAINEINSNFDQVGNINQEVVAARTDVDQQKFDTLGLRLNSMQNALKNKLDATTLSNYLPLTGGTVTGNLIITGDAIVNTMPTDNSSTNIANTAFVRSNVGILNNLNTTIKDTLVNAINEVNKSVGDINIEISDARTSTDGVVYATLDGRLDRIETTIEKAATKDMLNEYLSLKGGMVNGDVTINGTLSSSTPLYSDNSTKVATTQFIKTIVGGELGTLMTHDKTSLITAINEIKEYLDQLSPEGFIYNTYTNVVDVKQETNSIPIGLDTYDSTKDNLAVYLGGVRLLLGVGYNLSPDGKSVICGSGNWMVGDQLFFEMTKRERTTKPPIANIIKR